MYSPRLQSQSLRPLGNTQRLAIECEKSIIALVALLFFARRPAAVSGFVIAAVIFSVNAMATAWSSPYIGQERIERFSPAIADTDAACSVSMVTGVRLIVAAGNHAIPDLAFGRTRHSMCDLALGTSCSGHATTINLTPLLASKFCRGGYACSAAIADACPCNCVSVGTGNAFNDEHSETLPMQIAGVVMQTKFGVAKIGTSHNATLHERVVKWLEPPGVQPSARLAQFTTERIRRVA